MEKTKQAVPRSMLLLESLIVDGVICPQEQVWGLPMPKPLLVLCGDMGMSSSDTEELLDTLQWQGGRVSWAQALPLPPESP